MNLFGLELQQNQHAPGLLTGLLAYVSPSLVIELGTGYGGLTAYLGVWAITASSRIISWDIKECPLHSKSILTKLGVEARLADYNQPSEIAYIQESITQTRRCLLLCDGGNKPNDMLRFAPLLRKGDVIMAHDYAPDAEASTIRYKPFLDLSRNRRQNCTSTFTNGIRNVCS